jgi:hypothetical protein
MYPEILDNVTLNKNTTSPQGIRAPCRKQIRVKIKIIFTSKDFSHDIHVHPKFF